MIVGTHDKAGEDGMRAQARLASGRRVFGSTTTRGKETGARVRALVIFSEQVEMDFQGK